MFDDPTRELLAGPSFAALTAVLPNGQLSTQMMWVDGDDSHILIDTEVGRQMYRNVRHDPRVTVMLLDRSNPYRYSEIRGRVVGTVTGAEAREHIDQHIDQLSEKYTGGPYGNPIATERVIRQIGPERIRAQG